MAKILQINITCGVGSTGKISQALYEATIENGWEARFAYSAFQPTIKEAFRIENISQNYSRRAKNKLLGVHHHYSVPGTKRLINYIKKEKPDLIHLHNIQQNSTNYRILLEYIKNSNIPVVYTLHDCWSFTGGCYHFTSSKCDGYKYDCKVCPQNRRLDDVSMDSCSQYLIKKDLIGGNDNLRIVCVSNWLREVASFSYMGNMHYRPITIYNGVDTQKFYPRTTFKEVRERYGIGNEFIILGVASYWNESKGLLWFRELADKLKFDFRICLIGNCSLSEMKTDERFIFIPKTENEEVLAELYSTADVFINASYEETFGLTTVEAMACGTPVIVFNSTACPELVDAMTGIVCDCNLESLLSAVTIIKEKGKDTYSKACIEKVRNNFTNEIMVQQYMGIYRDCLLQQKRIISRSL